MLRILIGRANTGKSGILLDYIRKNGPVGTQQILLVPEHASYAAEVDLCRACGDGACCFAEVLTLPRLAVRVLSRTGGMAQTPLDKGGKVLLMQRAMENVSAQLRLYRRPSQKAAFLRGLVELSEELQRYDVAPEDLMDRSQQAGGLTGDKLQDISLVYAAYQAGLRREGQDLRDLLSRLEEALGPSGYIDGKDIYLDGFAYFSVQEERLLSVMLRRARTVTVALLGEKDSGAAVFRMGLVTQQRLQRLAADAGRPVKFVTPAPPPVTTALGHLERHFFEKIVPWRGEAGQVSLYRAESLFSEVEYVASQIRTLVASGQYRYRDIGVAARNAGDYEATVENIFRRYEIPVFMSRKSDILEKPVMTLILSALETVEGGWEYEDLFRCLKTGLSDIPEEDLFLLENYVIKWDIRGKMWRREEPWGANPDGYEPDFTDRQREILDRVNAVRERVRRPLAALAQGLRGARTAGEKLRALYGWLEDIQLPARLEERSNALRDQGENQLAEEYRQLWELLCQVFDQFEEILGDAPMDTEDFIRLLKLVLTQYSVGTIPAALDQVHLSDISRNDRHRTRCLFIIGANDGVLPMVETGGGILTREERSYLTGSGLRLAPDGEEQFAMELQNIYAALAKAEERLTVSWPAGDRRGTELRPSFIVERMGALLPGVAIENETVEKPFRLTAIQPAFEVAGSCRGSRLWQFMASDERTAPSIAALERSAAVRRGRLGRGAVESLYGRSLRLSASRMDKLRSCHFAYFMQYGLRAKERTPAGFDASQVGTFLHYVLEHVTREVMDRGGFDVVEDRELRKITDGCIDRFIREELGGLDQRAARMRHLFQRLRRTVHAVVENAAGELRESEFRPMSLELDFSHGGDLPAVTIQEGDAALAVGGRVDRVDGWLKDGRLYLRVVDYKTGKRSFDLADVYYGMNMQMLLYLFALEREGAGLYGHQVVPAGVLYFPARDVLLSMDRSSSEESIRAAMDRELRRSGLVLADPAVLQAMEPGALEGPKYLPLTIKRDGTITSGVATAEQLGKLGRYTEKILRQIAAELRGGVIDADPWTRSENDSACTWCEFASACHFCDGRDTDRYRPLRGVDPAMFWAHVDAVNGEVGKEDDHG